MDTDNVKPLKSADTENVTLKWVENNFNACEVAGRF